MSTPVPPIPLDRALHAYGDLLRRLPANHPLRAGLVRDLERYADHIQRLLVASPPHPDQPVLDGCQLEGDPS